MRNDDTGSPTAREREPWSATDDAAEFRRELAHIEAGLERAVEMFLWHTGRSDLALDFLRCLAAPRGTVH